MKRSTLLQTALLTCGLSFSAASIAGGASGEMLGNTCAGCHGTNGVSNGPAAPSLAVILSCNQVSVLGSNSNI